MTDLIIPIPPEIESYREDLETFLSAMVAKLYDNRAKGKWDSIGLEEANKMFIEEFNEFKDALATGDMDEAYDEAVDCANIALIMSSMIYQGRDNPFGPRVRVGTIYDFVKWAAGQNIDFCITWPYASKTGPNHEYGAIGKNLSKYGCRAHRVVCGLAHGDPPSDKHEAAHLCGNSLCMNPKHITWATRTENNLHKRFHRTNVTPVKLDWDKARAIRQAREAGETVKSLTEKFGVSRRTVYSVIRHQSYNLKYEPR